MKISGDKAYMVQGLYTYIIAEKNDMRPIF